MATLQLGVWADFCTELQVVRRMNNAWCHRWYDWQHLRFLILNKYRAIELVVVAALHPQYGQLKAWYLLIYHNLLL